LTNQSTIVALPGIEKTIRGYRADCIIFDEPALIDDAKYLACRPMAAVSDAKIFAIGSPTANEVGFTGPIPRAPSSIRSK
jgi:hypothetical protein